MFFRICKKNSHSLPPPLPAFIHRSFSSKVTCIKYFSTDSLRLYTAEQQSSVHLYSFRIRLPVLSLSSVHISTILSLSQLIENNKLVRFDRDSFIKIYNENGHYE